MTRQPARPEGAAHPPSTDGTPHRRAVRWPLRAGLAAAAAVALAASVASAEPATDPEPVAAADVVLPELDLTDALLASWAQPVDEAAEPALDDDAIPFGLHTRVVLHDVANGLSTIVPEAPAPPPEPEPEPAPEPAPAPPPPPPTTAAPAPPPPPPPPPPAPEPAPANGSVWDQLAQCESGGNWSINTGNGYYGGLQFSLSSWQGVGGTGYPHEASRETQIAMAERLKANGGWGHWPSCSRQLGLR